MKLSNLTVLFIALAFPIILLLSAYIEVQVDTLALQSAYNTKLLNSTYDAISALKMNTNNNDYSTVSDSSIRDIKACIATFTKSISSALGSSGYGEKYIMPYVPALVFTLYDGYYIYTPYEVIDDSGKTSYTHTLKPYVYYSKKYQNENTNTNIIISYSLDNYVTVYGEADGNAISIAGYLIADNGIADTAETVKERIIDIEYIKVSENATNDEIDAIVDSKVKNENVSSNEAQTYYKNALEFTEKYNKIIDKLSNTDKQKLLINSTNNPDDERSAFVQEKREVMKDSIVSNLNQAMANYTEHSKKSNMIFRLQEFSVEDWEKIYNNICMISFLEGMPVGTKTYNNYAVIASTGNELYTHKSQIYYIANGGKYYHKLGCPVLEEEIKSGNGNVVGYKKTDFDMNKKEVSISRTDVEGKVVSNERRTYYYCKHSEQACYNCIVESNSTEINYERFSDYKTTLDSNIINAYYKALGRIRNTQKKASSYIH